MIQPSNRAKNIKATVFNLSGLVGALGVILAITGDVFLENPDLAVLGKALAFVALVVLMPSKKKDEFYTGLWNSGASWAVIAVVLWSILGPFSAGVYDGLAGIAPSPYSPQMPEFTVLTAGFFAGFHWRKLRGPA